MPSPSEVRLNVAEGEIQGIAVERLEPGELILDLATNLGIGRVGGDIVQFSGILGEIG